jgi:hypothetical protein
MGNAQKRGNVRAIWLPVAFVLCFFAVGLPFWLIPYRSVNLPDALIAPGIFMVAAAALVLRVLGVSFWKVTGVMGAAVPAAVLARVIVDGVRDPTSHNLWPLEVVIALLMGLACAFAGVLAGSLVRLFVHDGGHG